jgi:signal transduction histidine kinase
VVKSFKIKRLFNKKDHLDQKYSIKRVIIIITLIIIGISFALFFYFQYQYENRIKNTIFDQHLKDQMDTTKALSENIKFNLILISTSLHGLAYSKYLQDKDFQSNNTQSILENQFHQINEIIPVDRLFVLDNKGIAKMNVVSKEQATHIGTNFSSREMVVQTKNTLSPVYSDGYKGIDGKYKIGITYPIIVNNNTKKDYIGLVGAVIPAIEFFKHFGNIYNINSSYIAVLDSKSIQLVHPVPALIGLPFFGEETQKITGNNELLKNHVKSVIATGKPSYSIYNFRNGERLNTGYPIFLEGNPMPSYSLFVITPTSIIYSKINDVIATERLEMFSLIAGITSAIIILIFILIRWNSVLDSEVKKRTKELEESNKHITLTNIKLKTANELLKVHDKMQKEFINIAAHELRTPIQPMLGLTEVIKNRLNDKEQKELLDVVIKNTRRLKNLAEDILDVTRFESNALSLNKEEFNLDELIQMNIKEFQNNLEYNKKIKFEYHTNIVEPVIIYADKNRISQVITNLINNSIKFIEKEGTISINMDKRKDNDNDTNEKVVISIKDTGMGIDNDILPQIFKKFTTKSFQGTGLGLYICKNIIENHGGEIWAANNKDGKGASFSFYLPLKK